MILEFYVCLESNSERLSYRILEKMALNPKACMFIPPGAPIPLSANVKPYYRAYVEKPILEKPILEKPILEKPGDDQIVKNQIVKRPSIIPDDLMTSIFTMFFSIKNLYDIKPLNPNDSGNILAKKAVDINQFCENWKRGDSLSQINHDEMILYLYAALCIGVNDSFHLVVAIEKYSRSDKSSDHYAGRTPNMLAIILRSIIIDGPHRDSDEMIKKKLKAMRFVFNKYPDTRVGEERDVKIVENLMARGFTL